MDKTKVNSALNSLFEYMTISEIAFNVMAGNSLDDKNISIVYDFYKKDHDELLRVLVNNFG
ncbi:hypothetical protein [Bacillus atrophaeus]|uniref:hypothetical protein n=1 Tax=Bacillus atrophaeus TaxID=1452 RepID=UPI00227FFA2B|nr:hypothetical protein [Bacillus atrophaeus]MCY8466445.1 hypothetical protein [Bacillus atrophaeus]MCY8478904.1 hypothetical protein [Bacillus atrophaeus]